MVPIHDYGDVDGHLFIEMPLIDGSDLRSELERAAPLPVDRTLRILGDLARGVDTAHAADLIHRDIKPANVMLTSRSADDLHAYLLDFGIARNVADTRITATGAAIGTPAYMAPEGFAGRSEQASDVYSLGCILFECLTGVRPFAADDFLGLMRQHAHDPPPRVSDLRPDLGTTDVDRVVRTAPSKDPGRRHGSAAALVDDASTALGRASLSAAPDDDRLLAAFERLRGVKDAAVAPDIPIRVLNRIRHRCRIPEAERVLAAVDTGVMRR